MIEEVVTTLYSIHEWLVKYPRVPVVVLKKEWITMKKCQSPTTHQDLVKGKNGQRCRLNVSFIYTHF